MYSLKKISLNFLLTIILVSCNDNQLDIKTERKIWQEFDKESVSHHNTEFQYERLKFSKLGDINIDTATLILKEVYLNNVLLDYKFEPQTNEIISVKWKKKEVIKEPLHNLDLYRKIKNRHNFNDRAILYILDQKEKDEQLKNIEYLESSINSLEEEIFSLSEK